jgi:putative Mn2+ efflux pump MntP
MSMSTLSLIIIAIGLAMDAFAVSISSGVVLGKIKFRHALLIASFFGGFQALMPFVGWNAGVRVQGYVAAFDHWIAFLLLIAVGAKMIWESRKDEASRVGLDPTRISILLVLAVATSIDALAVGLSLSFLDTSILLPVVVIGCVTFVLSLIGPYLGTMARHIVGSRVEAVGGLILITIGIRIVIEHTTS